MRELFWLGREFIKTHVSFFKIFLSIDHFSHVLTELYKVLTFVFLDSRLLRPIKLDRFSRFSSGFQQDINRTVIRYVDKENGEQKERPTRTKQRTAPWELLKCVWIIPQYIPAAWVIAHSTPLPGRLYKLNQCLAAGQELVLKSLFSKDFVWCS